MDQQQGGRLPSLDGLRGTAALLVMMHHLAAPAARGSGFFAALVYWPQELGWAGVDLFFVLSGFLITGILVQRRTAANYFSAFYVHRALRIFPLYFLLLAIVLVVFPALDLVAVNHPVWPYWFFLSNIRLVHPVGDIDYIGVTWTLSIEEQFYLAWSIAVFLFGARRLAQLAAIILLGSVMLRCSLIGIFPVNLLFTFTATHMDGLCVGAIVRLAYDSPNLRWAVAAFARSVWFWVLIYAVGISADIIFDHATWGEWTYEFNMRFGLTIVSLFFGALICCGLLFDGHTRKLFDRPWLQRMGAYSYFMYLYHFLLAAPILAVGTALRVPEGGPFGFLLLAAEFAVVISAAHLSYVYFERPILQLKELVRYRAREKSVLA